MVFVNDYQREYVRFHSLLLDHVDRQGVVLSLIKLVQDSVKGGGG